MAIKKLLFIGLACWVGGWLIQPAHARPRFIQKTGIGKASPDMDNSTQRRATSREAAIVVAQGDMLQFLGELRYKDGSTVGDRMEKEPEFSKEVTHLATKAVVVSSHWKDDETCTVVIQLSALEIRNVVGKVKKL